MRFQMNPDNTLIIQAIRKVVEIFSKQPFKYELKLVEGNGFERSDVNIIEIGVQQLPQLQNDPKAFAEQVIYTSQQAATSIQRFHNKTDLPVIKLLMERLKANNYEGIEAEDIYFIGSWYAEAMTTFKFRKQFQNDSI